MKWFTLRENFFGYRAGINFFVDYRIGINYFVDYRIGINYKNFTLTKNNYLTLCCDPLESIVRLTSIEHERVSYEYGGG